MPDKKYIKCYFGCEKKGILHRFPKPDYTGKERFDLWKKILDPEMKKRTDQYIYTMLRLCNKHFEKCYLLPSGKLNTNSIPTLNIEYCETRDLPLLQDLSVLAHSSTQVSSVSMIESALNYVCEQPLLQMELVNKDVMHSLQQSEPASVMNQPLQHDVPMVLPEVQPAAVNIPRVIGSQYNKKYQTNVKNLQARLKRMSKKCKNQEQLIKCAQKLTHSNQFLREIEKLPEPIQIFSGLQLKHKYKPRGRRYTIDEKVMALSILKQSAKAYKILKKMFVLPSKRCLQNLLSLIPLGTGINEDLFKNLKKDVRRLPQEKRLCTLIFDEVALEPGLHFNKGHIIGFEDFGYKNNNKIADHALVFMVKSIKGKYKQPICFTFCQSCTKSQELKYLVKLLIKKLHETGLQIVATICDQSQSNTSTIKSLLEDTREEYLRNDKEYKSCAFEVDGHKIFPIFDTPHLLKGIRNNFLKKEAKFVEDGITKIAKWEHLLMLFHEDVGEDEIRLVNKLTEAHLQEGKIPKMKVKYAAQVFSQRVSSAMRLLARHKILPPECEDTAQFLLIFDKLFDSFNGHTYSDSAKLLKGCLKNNSAHLRFWQEIKPVLKSITFKTPVKTKDGSIRIKYEKVPSINNWEKNIETFMEMWEYLKKQYKLANIITRNFNQDPLENFFCGIRSNGIRNNNPTCAQFINAFKTLVVNNLCSPHSVSANCENDNNTLLHSLKTYLKENIKQATRSQKDNNVVFSVDTIINNMSASEVTCGESSGNIVNREAKRYVAGYIIHKCQKNIFKGCQTCKNDLIKNEVDPATYTYYRDFTKKSLIYTKDEFINITYKIYDIIVLCLRDSPQERNLKEKIKFFIEMDVCFDILSCKKHKQLMIDYIVNLAINIVIHSWCKGVNQILKGKIIKFDHQDAIKVQAKTYYEKRCKSNKKIL